MLLFPIKMKYKKYHKRISVLSKNEYNYLQPLQGTYGLKVLTAFRCNSIQLETVKKTILKNLKKKF